jgi:hypothetical protein
MPNIKVKIDVGFSETEDPVTESNCPERIGDGAFKLVIGHEYEFDIDRLESALLHTSYPALRTALSEHLEQASKKKPAKN